MDVITVNLQSIELSNEQFYQLCTDNRNLRFERNKEGDLVIMSPTGGETGNRNIEIAYQLQAWSRQSQLGIAFDSSTGFILPNGATRSPDASWIPLSKWNNLTQEQRQKFVTLCPDFVIELRSHPPFIPPIRGDRGGFQEKMQEYLDNGTRLGWLINPNDKQVEIYRSGQNTEILNYPSSLSGEDILPDFVLNLQLIW
jgi:Uma2 family endonuclease